MIGITTASGQLGGCVIKHILNQGITGNRLVALARSPERVEHLAVHGITIRKADYTEQESLASAFANIETLVVIPSKSPVVPRIIEHNNVLISAKKAGVKRIVFLSISSAATDSVSLISPFILYAEAATRLSGMEWVNLRMGLYLEPIAEWVSNLIKMGRLPYPVKPDSLCNYVTREDVARATAAVATDSSIKQQSFELTGPAPVSMPELAKYISNAVGQSIPFVTISDQEYTKLSLAEGQPDFITQILISLYHALDRGEFSNVSQDIEKLTGKAPESAQDYLIRTVRKSHNNLLV